MKKQLLLFLATTALLVSCKKEETTQPETITPTVEETAIEEPKSTCYEYKTKDNEIKLQLQLNGEKASGSLRYNFKEKDNNKGTFEGTFKNNILIANYTFQSEGVESVRQVAFQLKDGKLIEGFGEPTADGTKFKDVSKLTFNSTLPLSEINCN